CMQTRSSSKFVSESSTNPPSTSTNTKRRNHRRSKQRVVPFALEEIPVVTMADQCLMAELLRAPTEGYAETIAVPPIPAEHFELKHSLINVSKVRNSRNKPIVSQPKSSNVDSSEIATVIASVITSAMTAMFKQHQVTPTPASVKAVEESCVTCGGAHSYRQCPVTDGNTFLGYHGNIQGYVSAAVSSYNQGNTDYRPQNVANQIRPPVPIQTPQVATSSDLEKLKKMNEVNIKAMQTQIKNVKNELRNEMQSSIQTSMSNQTNELKNMMASFFQMNIPSTSGAGSLPSNTVANPKGELKAITTRSGLVLDGPTVPIPPPFINPEEDERVEETLTDPEHGILVTLIPFIRQE
ncbi:hypothetical protein Tco_0735470, partial [Tanacetum coccineum]